MNNNDDMNEKIVITTGDPNGIGAEVTIKALNKLGLPQEQVVLVSNKKILDYYGTIDTNYEIVEIPFDTEVTPGKTTKESGEFVFQTLKKAAELRPKAIVTAPISKFALHLAGHFYNGQTEVLQRFLSHDKQHAEMLFLANDFRVLLLTRHCAMKEIKFKKKDVVNKVELLNDFFVNRLNIPNPKFALCGYNPHAGEDGVLGTEEREILNPACLELISKGIDITPPQPADTLFYSAAQAYYKPHKVPFDCYIAVYHDQGLIPIKTVAGIRTVNMTIGLDIIRTSPGHGTAFDIAGQHIADESGMIAAIKAVL